ncbi:hypothetical protein EDD17DRAFT_1510307 [Pisolithus thermaeus]|nr:hypothetical protein EV401DRAFT_1886683 [Pisolithus croceorrhizus]KAI6160485.1 hypothetical protein EDD17DRAFT_1510307 [Pisolithus thermaeus]
MLKKVQQIAYPLWQLMALKKRKHAESDVDDAQVDPSPPNALPVDHCVCPKRTGAGKGGATKQLKNCANAITHMAPMPSPKKAHQHVKTQPTGKKSTDQHGTASSKIFVDPVRTPTKFTTKPAFHLGDESSHFGFRGPPGKHTGNDCHLDLETMPMDEYLIQDWKNALEVELNGIKIDAHNENSEEVPTVQSEPEDRGHCSDTNDHLSDAGSIKGSSDDRSDKGDQGDSEDLDAEHRQQSAFRHGTPIDSNDDIEANESLEEEDTDTVEVILATNSQNGSELKEGKTHAHRVGAQQFNKVLIEADRARGIDISASAIESHSHLLSTTLNVMAGLQGLLKMTMWIPMFIKIAPTFAPKLRSYLCEDESIQWGKEWNFTHKALYTISTAVYYGTSQKLLGWAPEFKEYLLEAAIVLVAAGIKSVLCSLEWNSKIHNLETMMEPINWKLQEQLERWAKHAGDTSIGLVAGDEDEYALAPMD